MKTVQNFSRGIRTIESTHGGLSGVTAPKAANNLRALERRLLERLQQDRKAGNLSGSIRGGGNVATTALRGRGPATHRIFIQPGGGNASNILLSPEITVRIAAKNLRAVQRAHAAVVEAAGDFRLLLGESIANDRSDVRALGRSILAALATRRVRVTSAMGVYWSGVSGAQPEEQRRIAFRVRGGEIKG